MSYWRKIEIIIFLLFTLGSLAFVLLAWMSLHLLNFPCDDPTGRLSCDQVVIRAFTEWAGGAFLLWALAAWLTFKKRGED